MTARPIALFALLATAAAPAQTIQVNKENKTIAITATIPAANAADTLHIAVTAGANNSGAINWTLADDNTLEAEAASKALEHARQIADRMAKGLNAKLGTLIYASNQQPSRDQFINGYTGGRIARNLKPLAIIPDKVTRTATVYAVFAIE